MHGVKRGTKTPRQQARLAEYLGLTEDVLARKRNGDRSEEALRLTGRLLQINPEFYTIWNYRRNILLDGIFPGSTPEQVNDLISDDLATTMAALKAHPKVYWIWNHRRWCLENVPKGPGMVGSSGYEGWQKVNWDKELQVVEKMLDRDARNFHAWNYRRYILASMPVRRAETRELAYTTRKIEANMSNFSAWHQRSKVITSLLDKGEFSRDKIAEEEFELVRNAMYTDPNDQSVWLYHRWLVGSGRDKNELEREISGIEELLEEQPDSRWCMDSLVRYKRLLEKEHGGEVEYEVLLKRLVELDRRYVYL